MNSELAKHQGKNITFCITIDVQASNKFKVVGLAKSKGFVVFFLVEVLLRVTIRQYITGLFYWLCL